MLDMRDFLLNGDEDANDATALTKARVSMNFISLNNSHKRVEISCILNCANYYDIYI